MCLQVLLRCVERMFPVQNTLKIPFPAHKRGQDGLFPDFPPSPPPSPHFSTRKKGNFNHFQSRGIFKQHHSGPCPDSQARESICENFPWDFSGIFLTLEVSPGSWKERSFFLSPSWYKNHPPLLFLRLVKIPIGSSQSVQP